MAGKHSAGGSARKQKTILQKTILLAVICLVAFGVVVGVLAWRLGAQPMPVTEISDAPADSDPTYAGEEVPGSGGAAPVEEAPEEEVPGEEVPEEEVSVEENLMVEASEEPAYTVLRLEVGAGQSRHVYVQHNPGGMSTTEFLAEGDMIVALAESTYASVVGLDDATVESFALGFTMTEIPDAYAGDAELFWERQGDWLVMVSVLKNLDDPEKLEAFGDLGLMRIVQGDSYTLSEGEAFLLSLGYEKQ